jgi:hypothetical protein
MFCVNGKYLPMRNSSQRSGKNDIQVEVKGVMYSVMGKFGNAGD